MFITWKASKTITSQFIWNMGVIVFRQNTIDSFDFSIGSECQMPQLSIIMFAYDKLVYILYFQIVQYQLNTAKVNDQLKLPNMRSCIQLGREEGEGGK